MKEKRYKREIHKFMGGGRDEHHGGMSSDGVVGQQGDPDGVADKGKERGGDGIGASSATRAEPDLDQTQP